jgi:two-component system, NarL family, invasion response regulator UvrY
MDITDQQIEFLKLACTDATYKEIADRMKLTVRSVDSIRDTLFLRLEVRSRVGLAVMAIKNGLVQLSCD